MRISGPVIATYLSLSVSLSAQEPPQPPLAPLAAAVAVGPRTLLPAHIACIDRPTSARPEVTLRIVAPHAADRHDASTKNQLVVLNAGTNQGLLIGQQYYTRRLSPAPGSEPMSAVAPAAIRTTGWLTVVAANEHTALARVDYTCTTVESGDYLEPYVAPALPVAVGPAGRTDFADLSRVLFGTDRRELFGVGDFLSIDRGAMHGLVQGTRVAFYRDRGTGTPLVELGVGVVLDVSAHTAKVVVERASEDVRRGDYVGVRGRP